MGILEFIAALHGTVGCGPPKIYCYNAGRGGGGRGSRRWASFCTPLHHMGHLAVGTVLYASAIYGGVGSGSPLVHRHGVMCCGVGCAEGAVTECQWTGCLAHGWALDM